MATSQYSELGTITAPPRDTLQDRVYREIRMAIMRGRFKPGRPLPIRGVASALGVSSMPVREALRQLVTEKALVMGANRTFAIADLSRARFEDVLQVRMEIEGYAAGRATARLTDADVDRLASTNDEMHVAIGQDDRERYIELNQQFHFDIYRAAGSEALIPIIESLWLQVGPYLGISLEAETSRRGSPDRHRDMIEAFRARDAEQAMRMLRADLSEGADVIIGLGAFDGVPG